MIVLEILIVLFCVALGVTQVRSGLRSWRSQVRFDKASALTYFDPQLKIGVERGLLPMGVAAFFVGLLIGMVGVLNAAHLMGSGPAQPSPALVILLLVLLVGTLGSLLLAMSINMIARPRFLIPPHLRPGRALPAAPVGCSGGSSPWMGR